MIPFTTCLRLRKRHKQSTQQSSSGTTSEELVAKSTSKTAAAGETSKESQDFDREVEESLEARRCAWRLMEQRMAEPGAKKVMPPVMTGTTTTTAVHSSHGKLARGRIYFIPGRECCFVWHRIASDFPSCCLSFSRLWFRMLCGYAHIQSRDL